MMFKQVKDILTQIQNIQNDLNNYYTGISGKTDREKVKILLDSVKETKNKMVNSIEEYKEHGNIDILNTWIQYSPENPVHFDEAEYSITTDMNVEEVVKRIIRHDNWLDTIYEYIAETASSTAVRNVFENMHQNLEHEKRNLSKDVDLIEDM
jgi:hypothetical protein